MPSAVPAWLLALAAAAALPAAAQETVWSSVIFLMNGERTPLHGGNVPQLTPLGAQQMYAQGSVFRARYLEGNTTFSDDMNRITTHAPIANIETDALDAIQVTARSTDDSYVAAGALAFLQGLYPPQTSFFASGNGGRDAAVLSNNTLINFPLNGYQYPLLQTFSDNDMASPWLEGHSSCSAYQMSTYDFRQEATAVALYNESLAFYKGLWASLFQTTFSSSMTNFYYAYDLYDYAAYEYAHNPQTANAITESVVTALRYFATAQQTNLNADLYASGEQEGDMIRAVSGRMLATYVARLLRSSITSSGSSDKISLLFGSFEPFLAYFRLTGLYSNTSGNFTDLPGAGAAMVWELYSKSDNTSDYPSTSDLYVRFLYRPNTDNGSALTEYSLFNGSSSASMSFTDFSTAMSAIGISSVTQWCTMCNSISIFCNALEDNSNGGSGSSGGSGSGSSGSSRASSSVTPAVGGVIGAAVTLAVILLAGTAAMLFGGFRFYRKGKATELAAAEEAGKRTSGGGFKGVEKKPDDNDVAVSKTGVRHERVGSWELNDGSRKVAGSPSSSVSPVSPASPPVHPASVGAVLHGDRMSSNVYQVDSDDDLVNLVGPPVVPREHV